MGMASHLGPWLLGTVKNTTGTNPALGQVRNMGATVCVQTATFSVPSGTTASGFTTTNLFTIPAGSVIHAIILDSVAAISATGTNTITFQTGNATTGLTGNSGGNYPAASAIATVSGTNTIAQGRATATPSATNLALLNNVGTTDIIVQVAITLGATSTAGGTQNVQIVYGVRNADGTYAPTSSQA